MDFIKVIRAGDGTEITINVNSIVSYWDNKNDTGHISLINQEYIETAKPIASDLRKQLSLTGNRIIKVGE